jgi:hypothetical protein
MLFRLLFLAILLINGPLLLAQTPCNSPAEFPADDCGQVCVGCSLQNYSGSNANFSANGLEYCNGDIVDNKSVWHGFIANAATVSITVDPSGCSSNDGLQLAIFSNCEDAIACNPGNGNAGPLTIEASVVPGEVYYLLINGKNGAVCNYNIIAISGVELPGTLGATGPVTGPASVCLYSTFTYSIAPVANALFYEWTAPPGATVNGSTNNTIILPASEGTSVDVFFNNLGGGQVKVKSYGFCGQTGTTSVKNVTANFINTTLPPINLTPNDLPYNWFGDPITTSGLYQMYLTSWQGCDSVITQVINIVQQCKGRVFWDINGNGVYNAGSDIPAPGIQVKLGSSFTSTNVDGLYEFPSGNLNQMVSVPVLPQNATSITPASQLYNGNASSYNFAIQTPGSPVSGTLFFDDNGDGIFNAGEMPLVGFTVRTTSGKTAVSNANGFYSLASVAWPEFISILSLPSFYQVTGGPNKQYVPGVSSYNFAITNNTAYGFVYWDTNLDNVISAGDIVAAGVPVQLSPNVVVVTNANGGFSFPNSQFGDTIQVVNVPNTVSIPAFHVVNPAAVNGYHILLSTSTQPDLALDITNATVFRPGFLTNVTATVANVNQFASNVVLGLRFPGFLTVDFTSLVPVFLSADSIAFDLGSMAPGQTQMPTVRFKTPTNAAIGTPVVIRGYVRSALPEAVLLNNKDIITTTVVGSYDPNDKQVDPAYVTPEMLAEAAPLEYLIRFQNTGNYPADQVEIIDTLAANLQWGSLRMIASSHPCTWTISPDGVVKFLFADIFLPDSVSNEPESHGFVKFSILPVEGLEIGDKVANFCDIYFDFNAPIRTNTADMNVVLFLPGNAPTETPELSVRPNPASYYLRLSWAEALTNPGIITLYNVNGLPVLSDNVEAGNTGTQLNTSWLQDGVYVLTLQSGARYYVKRVMIVQSGGIRRE